MGDLGSALLLSIAIFMWVREDAWRRSYVRSNTFNVSLIGLTLLVLPYYLFKTRGLSRGLKAIGVVLALYALVVFSSVLGALFIRLLEV